MSQFGGHFPMSGMQYGTYYGVYPGSNQEPLIMNHPSYPVTFSHPQLGQQIRPIQVDHYHPGWASFQPMMGGNYIQGQPYSHQGLIPGLQTITPNVNYIGNNPQEPGAYSGSQSSQGLIQQTPVMGMYLKTGNPMTGDPFSKQGNQEAGAPTSQLSVETIGGHANILKMHRQQDSNQGLSHLKTTEANVVEPEPVASVPKLVVQPTNQVGDPSMQRPSTMSWMAPRVDSIARGRTTGHPAYKDINLVKFCADDFEFGPKIGKGKYGDVYLCKDKRTNFIVAIKVLDKMTIRQMRALRQIVREIKHHSYLKHENIIKLYGVFHDEEKIYMIMEYACDGELYKELKSSPGRKFSEDKASNYIKQVLEAINYLHENDIIHRDIKPENLLKSFGQIKLADFGWSVYAPESKNKRKTFCGTLDYVPPEMVQGEKYDYHIDNWGIGVLAYEFVTGQPPFGKKTMRDTLDCIVEGELIIPEGVSKEATDFIRAMLQSNPKLRMELSDALVHPWITKHNP